MRGNSYIFIKRHKETLVRKSKYGKFTIYIFSIRAFIEIRIIQQKKIFFFYKKEEKKDFKFVTWGKCLSEIFMYAITQRHETVECLLKYPIDKIRLTK